MPGDFLLSDRSAGSLAVVWLTWKMLMSVLNWKLYRLLQNSVHMFCTAMLSKMAIALPVPQCPISSFLAPGWVLSPCYTGMMGGCSTNQVSSLSFIGNLDPYKIIGLTFVMKNSAWHLDWDSCTITHILLPSFRQIVLLPNRRFHLSFV